MTKEEQTKIDMIYNLVKDMKNDFRKDIENLRTKISIDIKGVYQGIENHSRNCSTQRELTDHKSDHKDDIKNKQWTIGQVIVVATCIITLVVTIYFNIKLKG